MEFATKNILDPSDNILVKAQIWDTAGQERYRAITSAYYRGALGALIVYDVTQPKSLENAGRWLTEVKDNASSPDMVIALVGNKVDLVDDRQIDVSMAIRLAETEGLLYFETSAKAGDDGNVHTAFERMVFEIKGMMMEKKKKIVKEEDEEDEDAEGDEEGGGIGSGGVKIAIDQPEQEKRSSSNSSSRACCSSS